ncbi:MAG: copper homeostasis protein CutC, partial [Erysipelotrichaceae bacterium]|nr:copper homeostasis protein CutC [Erysipelotrichaceae bacterium]
MINNITVEICVGNIDDALTACKYPVDRIELNSALELGGLTPSIESLRFLKERVTQKICCMVRPRGGDFIYSDNEFEVMKKDAALLLESGADGIVFGFLKDDHTVDVARTKEMADLIHSQGKQAVFHKAFDDTSDLNQALEDLIGCGIDRILTSGGSVYPHIIEGCRIING